MLSLFVFTCFWPRLQRRFPRASPRRKLCLGCCEMAVGCENGQQNHLRDSDWMERIQDQDKAGWKKLQQNIPFTSKRICLKNMIAISKLQLLFHFETLRRLHGDKILRGRILLPVIYLEKLKSQNRHCRFGIYVFLNVSFLR